MSYEKIGNFLKPDYLLEIGDLLTSPKITIHRFLIDENSLSKSFKLYFVTYLLFWYFLSFVLNIESLNKHLIIATNGLYVLSTAVVFYYVTKIFNICSGFKASLVIVALFKSVTNILLSIAILLIAAILYGHNEAIWPFILILLIVQVWEISFWLSYGKFMGAKWYSTVICMVVFQGFYYLVFVVFANISKFTNNV